MQSATKYPDTNIHITAITDTLFVLGEATPNSNGVENLKDGNTYGYITNNGAIFEQGTGQYTSATRQFTRTIVNSSSLNNQPQNWPVGTVLRITVPPAGQNSNNSGGGGSSVVVIDKTGDSSTAAISQRAATVAINACIASIEGDQGIAAMQLDKLGNILVTDKAGTIHIIPKSIVSGDGVKTGDALFQANNLYISQDGSILLVDSSGKMWTLPDVTSMTKAISDATGNGEGNTSYATINLSNVTDGVFQARKLSADQVITALGFKPLSSDTDLANYATKDLKNVDPATIQSLEFVSKQITDALGYTPAQQIDTNSLAQANMSNVSGDDINKRIGYTPANAANTATTNTITDFELGSDNSTLSIKDKSGNSYTVGGATGNNAAGDPLTTSISGWNNKDGTNQQSILRIIYKSAAPHGTGDTYGVRVYGDPKEAVVTDLATVNWVTSNFFQGNSANFVTGLNGTTKSVSNIYAHNTGTGTTVGANENITVNFTNYGGKAVAVEMATQPWIQANYLTITAAAAAYQPKGTYLTAANIVQSVGTSTTITLSQAAIANNYALKSSIPTIAQDLSSSSTTAAPSQKAVVDGLLATVKSSKNGRVGQLYFGGTNVTDSSSYTDQFFIDFAQDAAANGTLPFTAELASKKFTEATYLKAAPNIAGGNKADSAISGWDGDTTPEYQSVVQLICKKIDGYTLNGGYQATVVYNAFGGGVTTPIALAAQADIADLQSQITALTARVAKLENPSG